MYTVRFSLFFSFYASEMGDVKALISHQMFVSEETPTVGDFLEKKGYLLSNLVLDLGQDCEFL